MNRWVLAILVIAGVALYIRSPVDLLPDRMGAMGLVDDLVALGLGLWWFWRRLPRFPAGASPGGGGAASSSSPDSSPEPKAFDPHEILGVGRRASSDEVKRAYHDRLREYHPDRVDHLGDDLRELAHLRTLDIRRAYDELKKKS